MGSFWLKWLGLLIILETITNVSIMVVSEKKVSNIDLSRLKPCREFRYFFREGSVVDNNNSNDNNNNDVGNNGCVGAGSFFSVFESQV